MCRLRWMRYIDDLNVLIPLLLRLSDTDHSTTGILHCQDPFVDNYSNLTGAVVLPHITKSSDYICERVFHIVFVLTVSTAAIIISRAIDILGNKVVAYLACFLVAAGAYIHS
ncbi:uncharacterized protein N7498_007840 [Penicillium cinerascens]|uniref:Uncharacterized protein n=1 Tax=Penicillium cinerascens TaxID=70096 RepID=A0A9W9JKT2_9EURO|nr:uncharacterized protein N7498_007840 [Penicillium cinerascens]KAJ5198723.1 hypothetical protein N7498_007840 [Penicillium cinerascens]